MKFAPSVWLLVLLALSGLADSFGFFYASRIWQHGSLSAPDLVRSAMGWVVGITLYVLSLRYFAVLGVSSAEIQTLVWFAMTLIGVVALSGQFFKWPLLEQSVAVSVIVALGWLLVRTGA
jgi:hypothetical protein